MKGLGDAVKVITDATGITKLTETITGGDCGCKKRQEWLNKVVPFKHEKDGQKD